ncbi:unnamed protein product, partial [Tuber aestivum]
MAYCTRTGAIFAKNPLLEYCRSHAFRKNISRNALPIVILISNPLHSFPIPEQRFPIKHTPSFKLNHRSNLIEVRLSTPPQTLFIPSLSSGDCPPPSTATSSTNTRSQARSFHRRLTALPLRVCGSEVL